MLIYAVVRKISETVNLVLFFRLFLCCCCQSLFYVKLCRGICKTQAHHVRELINTFTPVMSSAYDNQRVAVTAFFSEVS